MAQLGAPALAALGVGTIVLSSVFWVFNFLSIGTQTEVAQTYGRDEAPRRAALVAMAILMSTAAGVLLILLGMPLAPLAAEAMGASDRVLADAIVYIRIRLLGAPAVLIAAAVFGALRGLQDMRTPLWIAVGVNGLNIVLDALLISGMGPIPALGIAGAAWASVASQWIGAVAALGAVARSTGWSRQLDGGDAGRLLVIGGDLFIRTGLLTAFLLLATRAATKMGPESGAAHQAIRQFWTFSALLLDAFAVTGQSLVGFFVGASDRIHALKVARYVCAWSVGTGVALALLMWMGEPWVVQWLVPASAVSVFATVWYIAALFQPINALSFATDGIHWGTGDFRYLRNAVLAATAAGVLFLTLVDAYDILSLSIVWWITGVWIVIRAVLGVIRIWPGVGKAPLHAFGKEWQKMAGR